MNFMHLQFSWKFQGKHGYLRVGLHYFEWAEKLGEKFGSSSLQQRQVLGTKVHQISYLKSFVFFLFLSLVLWMSAPVGVESLEHPAFNNRIMSLKNIVLHLLGEYLYPW